MTRLKNIFANPHRPLVIAHRGGSLEAPENTLAALKHGIACGSDWQEVDITLSKDGYPVIIHDDTLERTTTGQGQVSEQSLSALQALRAGAPHWSQDARERLFALGVQRLPEFGDRYARESIPTLQQVLALPQARLMLELKTTPYPQKLARAVVTAVEQAHMQDRVILGSFDFATVQAVRELAPALPLVGIVESVEMLKKMQTLHPEAVAVDTAMLPEAVAQTDAKTAVWTWTVYTPEQAEQFRAAGADGLITDIPQSLREHLMVGHSEDVSLAAKI